MVPEIPPTADRPLVAEEMLSTELFRFATTADPGAVWRALTCSPLTSRYFHGLTLVSDWQPGSPVTAHGHPAPMGGVVLDNVEGHRLSFTLGAGDDQPETFVTWEIRETASGSIVRLYVDELVDEDTETVWLAVVSGLQALLATMEGAPATRR
jgi:uncharacterized protein YndB with AHSA1/START domain